MLWRSGRTDSLGSDYSAVAIDTLGVGGKLAALIQQAAYVFDSTETLDVTQKRDKTLVSNFDIEVQQTIILGARSLFPDIAVLSEETASDDFSAESRMVDNRQLLILDPIDGTNNFVNGFPLYAVSLAFMEARESILTFSEGAIFLPPFNKIFFTSKERIYETSKYSAAALQISSRQVREITNDDVLFLNLAFYSHFEASTLKWSPSTPVPRTTCSTAIDLLFTALGIGVGTITAARLWDIAGGIALGDRLCVHLHDYETGEKKKSLNLSDFIFGSGVPWQLKRPHLFCRPEHFSRLKGLINYQPIDMSKLQSRPDPGN